MESLVSLWTRDQIFSTYMEMRVALWTCRVCSLIRSTEENRKPTKFGLLTLIFSISQRKQVIVPAHSIAAVLLNHKGVPGRRGIAWNQPEYDRLNPARSDRASDRYGRRLRRLQVHMHRAIARTCEQIQRGNRVVRMLSYSEWWRC